jgi:hypothetical protein
VLFIMKYDGSQSGTTAVSKIQMYLTGKPFNRNEATQIIEGLKSYNRNRKYGEELTGSCEEIFSYFKFKTKNRFTDELAYDNFFKKNGIVDYATLEIQAEDYYERYKL